MSLENNVQGWNPDTFSFDPNFQKQIIAVMVNEPKIFERLGLVTDYKFFEIREFSEIFKHLQEFFHKYRGIPSKEALYEIVAKNYNPDTLKDTIDEIYDGSHISGSTVQFIEENVKNFISCQAIKKAIYESIDDLGDIKKHQDVKTRIEKALTVGASLDDLGANIYEDDEIIGRWQRRLDDTDIKRISSGWTRFDAVFGGFGKGELFSFMGPAHSGKSMYLVNVGANILLQKYNVLHVSLEMSEEITTERYDMRLLGLTQDELKENIANSRLKELLSKHIGNLIVKRFPANTVTATDITTYMKRLENVKGFVPDVLIIDYADIMRSSSRYNDRRFELDTIYQEVRNIGIEFDIPVITATQLNRQALAKLEAGGILTEEFIAESYGIQRILDQNLTLNSTPADNANNVSIIYVCKNRSSGGVGESWRMYVDFTRSLVKEWSADSINTVKKAMKHSTRT